MVCLCSHAHANGMLNIIIFIAYQTPNSLNLYARSAVILSLFAVFTNPSSDLPSEKVGHFLLTLRLFAKVDNSGP